MLNFNTIIFSLLKKGGKKKMCFLMILCTVKYGKT